MFEAIASHDAMVELSGAMNVCREGQLTHLFFPGRVGQGYGPDWTLVFVFVVSPAPIGWLVGWLQPKKPKDAPKYMKKSVFGTEKTPGGRAQVLVASFKSKSRPWAPKIYTPFADLFSKKVPRPFSAT